jgi:hypothetical protein
MKKYIIVRYYGGQKPDGRRLNDFNFGTIVKGIPTAVLHSESETISFEAENDEKAKEVLTKIKGHGPGVDEILLFCIDSAVKQ